MTGNGPKKKPESVRDVLSSMLKESGLADRVDQARVVPDWPRLVGPQIAQVTEPRSISPDGTLFVFVATNAWMTELSLLEPELLRSLNVGRSQAPIKRVRWLLRR